MNAEEIRGAALAENLRYLMQRDGLSEHALARRAKIAQKTINNILNGATSPTLETITRLGAAFGLPPWCLIIPDLPTELLDSARLNQLIKLYAKARPSGRDFIQQVAERESEYARQDVVNGH